MPLHAFLAFKRRGDACFGRSTPICSIFLALNASFMLVSGVQRQLHALSGVERQPDAPYWRLNASEILLQGVIFLLLFFIPFSIFIFIL